MLRYKLGEKMRINEFNERIAEIENALGYVFRDKSLLRQAFTRSSWCNENGADEYQSNEVLEFFGDSVLSAAVVTLLLDGCSSRYKHGIKTELGEGDFSNIKSKLSDKTNLSGSTKRLGLEKYLLLGEGDAKLGIENEPSVMEDLFESIVGAVYIDSDRDMAEVIRLVGRILDTSVYTDGSAHALSPKNQLQEWCADKHRRLASPVYKTLSEEGPDHKKTYVRGVFIDGRMIASASGKNQKTADAAAAKEALLILAAEESTNTQPLKRKEDNAKDRKHPSSTESDNGMHSREVRETGNKPKQIKPRSAKSNTHPIDKTKRQMGKKDIKQTSGAVAAHSIGTKAKGITESALTRLKRHAEECSAASPSFKDLGMGSDGHGAISYRVECSFMGKKIIAAADSRIEARERAAELIVKALKLK